MAKQIPDAIDTSVERVSRRKRLPLSPTQLQAYLLARETLRRLKPTSGPCFARDPAALAPAGKRPCDKR